MNDVVVKVHEIKSIGSSPAPNNRNRLKQLTLLHSEAHSITRIRGHYNTKGSILHNFPKRFI